MIEKSEDKYLRTAGGLYVAWSLAVPSSWGQWCLVAVVERKSPYRGQSAKIQIVPKRIYKPAEVQALKMRPLMLWGVKVDNTPWALVMGRVASVAFRLPDYEYSTHNPVHSIGV